MNINSINLTQRPTTGPVSRRRNESMPPSMARQQAQAPEQGEISRRIGNFANMISTTIGRSSANTVVRVDDGVPCTDFTMRVDQIAKNQQNRGRSLNNGGMVDSGEHTFDITVDGRTHRITINLDQPMSTQDFKRKVADEINAANIGITAGVETSSDGRSSRLTLESETGAGPGGNGVRFALQDVEGRVVRDFRLNNVTQLGQSAVYWINDQRRVSESNQIVVHLPNSDVHLTLLSAYSADVHITAYTSAEEAYIEMGMIMEEVNEALENDDVISREIARFLQKHSQSLESLGLLFEDGRLIMADSARFIESIERGEALEFLQNAFGDMPDGTSIDISL